MDIKRVYNVGYKYPDIFNTPSLIQTLLSVLELHQILRLLRLRTVTAGRELHPALKTCSAIRFCMIIADQDGMCKWKSRAVGTERQRMRCSQVLEHALKKCTIPYLVHIVT